MPRHLTLVAALFAHLALAATTAAATGPISIPATSCKFELNNTHYDLSALTTDPDDPDKSVRDSNNRNQTFRLNVCAPVRHSLACSSQAGSVCLFASPSGEFETIAGKWGVEPLPTWTPLADVDGVGVLLTFTNGFDCESGTGERMARTTLVRFYCEPEDRAVLIDAQSGVNCTDEVWVFSPHSCPVQQRPDDDDNDLSGGWVFVIMVLTACALYFVCGTVYKSSVQGTSGTESVPHVRFWRECPGLVWDGCRFVFFKLTCRGRRDAYDSYNVIH